MAETMYVDCRTNRAIVCTYWLPRDLVGTDIVREIGHTNEVVIIAIWKPGPGQSWQSRRDAVWHAVSVALQHDGYSVLSLRDSYASDERKRKPSKRQRETESKMRNMFD